MSWKTSIGFGSGVRFRIMAGFIPRFPVKCNFDGLSPVTIHFQPSFFVIFCGGGEWVMDHELKNFQWVCSGGRFRIMASFITGFPVKCNFDGLSPVTIHFQPSSFVIFCGSGVVSLSPDSEFSTGSSSISLSLSLFELLSFSDERSSSPSLPLYSNMRWISFSDCKRVLS